ncbi:hypothetical protein JVT61DRAFT_341 [Boletus reticuloceps]|uniref:BTB domain-containing protein n=1 Tax=Boletus reticuloceps TaxID=495285 RepID=A0A8I3ADP8_9AGAM|nr:hypothetical protein JVT61DRAFT_341 [Boletus reticuloceps]
MSNDSTYAAVPFDHAKADIILRSSDNIDFRVFKLFLSLASPFFETFFEIPQSAEEDQDQEAKDGLVVVPVTEDSKTLDALLRFCYPCTLAEDPELEVLKDVLDVLEAARKYSLDDKKARQAITSPKLLEADPLRCFAFAHRGRLQEESQLAARYTLTQPLIPSWFQEIDLITATDLLSLLTDHKKCGDAEFTGLLLAVGYRHCGCPRSNTPKYMLFLLTANGLGSLRWWEDFMEETFTALRDKPCKETVQASADKTVQTVKARNCQDCSTRITEGMRDFLELFTRKIDESISQIEVELNF